MAHIEKHEDIFKHESQNLLIDSTGHFVSISLTLVVDPFEVACLNEWTRYTFAKGTVYTVEQHCTRAWLTNYQTTASWMDAVSEVSSFGPTIVPQKR